MNTGMMCSKKWFAVLSLVVVLYGSVGVSGVRAQSSGLLPGEDGGTNPKNRPVNMSLTISDNEDPTAPVLIAPSNGSVVGTSTPAFVWVESTDNYGISHYILTLDGSVLFNNIPTSATANSNYTLTKAGSQLTLTPVNGLSQGNHTWKITAVDVNGRTKDSATWTFTIPSPTATPTPTETPTPTPTLTPTPTITPGGPTLTPTPTPEVTETPISDVTVSPAQPEPTATPQPSFLPEAGGNPIPQIVENVINAVEQIPQAVVDVAQDVAQETAPVANVVVATAVPAVATAALATQFGWGISFQIVLRILQAIGILPPPSPQGLVEY
jgi:hypothetical protein